MKIIFPIISIFLVSVDILSANSTIAATSRSQTYSQLISQPHNIQTKSLQQANVKQDNAKFLADNKQKETGDFTDAKAYILKGMIEYKLGNYQKAIADFDRAISLDSKFGEAYAARGAIKYRLENKQEAITDFDRAISLSFKNDRAYYIRGRSKLDLGNDVEAIADFDRAIEINPKYADAYILRGLTKYQKGNEPDAISDIRKGAELFRQQGESAKYTAAIILLGSLSKK